MFGLNKKPIDDKLAVQVHVIASTAAFDMAQKVWGENMRSLQFNQTTSKEIMHFAYAQPKCVVWLQRDQGRTDTFELIVRWEEDMVHEVYIITRVPQGVSTMGNDHRLQELLHSILTVPSIVPSTAQDGAA
jgi:hypothetical protein